MVESHELDIGVTTSLAEDRVYRALAARPRRRLLSYLLEESSATRAELARVLAGWRAGESETMVDEADHRDILLDLHHSHLPHLDESGLIEYDRDAGVVALQAVDEGVEQVIRRSIEAETESHVR